MPWVSVNRSQSYVLQRETGLNQWTGKEDSHWLRPFKRYLIPTDRKRIQLLSNAKRFGASSFIGYSPTYRQKMWFIKHWSAMTLIPINKIEDKPRDNVHNCLQITWHLVWSHIVFLPLYWHSTLRALVDINHTITNTMRTWSIYCQHWWLNKPYRDRKFHIQCALDISRSFSLNISRKTPHSSPVRARHGVSLVNPKFGQRVITSIIIVLWALSCYMWPRYIESM